MLNDKWLKIIKKLDFAFQPIVNMKSGEIYAVEALLRNVKEAGGFHSIFNLFDEAFHDGVLYQLDLELRYLAIQKFSKIDIKQLYIFYNLDNRILYAPDFKVGNTELILKKFNLDKQKVCFELSERGTLQDPSSVTAMVTRYKQSDFKIAIDDFGTGVAGFQMLYYAEAEYIKIDRFFIQNIQSDNKKRLFCCHIIKLAHIMGISVIVEGVETKEEYFTCKEIEADLIQGYFVQKPQRKIEKIVSKYTNIEELYKKDLRNSQSNKLDKSMITYIDPLYSENLDFMTVFKYFKEHKNTPFVPIVNHLNLLQGVIREQDVRELSYSQYGMALARNTNLKSIVERHINHIVSADINWNIDKILEIYNINTDITNGIFMLRNGKYHGFIDLKNLLYLSYKRNLEIASEQNPLSRLPGNKSIELYLNDVFENNEDDVYSLIYFDFNSFKPFNDIYGFRKGDRAILLFRDILKKKLGSKNFIAHIGGDDFFAGIKNTPYKEVFKLIASVQKNFQNQVTSLYNKEDREAGYIETKDRFDTIRKFDLLSVSCAIIEVCVTTKKEEFDEIISQLKKESKKRNTPVGASCACNQLF